jgi:hypothetical protein
VLFTSTERAGTAWVEQDKSPMSDKPLPVRGMPILRATQLLDELRLSRSLVWTMTEKAEETAAAAAVAAMARLLPRQRRHCLRP